MRLHKFTLTVITLTVGMTAVHLVWLRTVPLRNALRFADVSRPSVRSIRTEMLLGEAGDKEWRSRLIQQMKFVPKAVLKEWELPVGYQNPKKIVVINDQYGDRMKDDQAFISYRCPVSQCTFSTNQSQASLESADAILFRQNFSRPNHQRPPNQLWVLALMESPFHSPDLQSLKGDINWTASYRLDSTIYIPYGLYRPFNRTISRTEATNYASGKTKKVAWVVSHCNVPSKRKDYVKELAKYIPVDIFGGCGTKNCPDNCFESLGQDYKFYLSFENSLCRDYITEKFFRNGLSRNMLPIVRGAPFEDYKKLAPPDSFLHVDNFSSPKALAEYLYKLDRDDELYNSYFKWKEEGNVYAGYYGFSCRLCGQLWAERRSVCYDDVDKWWRGKGVCIQPN